MKTLPSAKRSLARQSSAKSSSARPSLALVLYNTAGFSLVEVLIALAISSIALLGLAAGQLQSLKYATNSFNYTLSLVQANNAIERTWVNLCALQNGTLDYNVAYRNAHFIPQIDLYGLTPTPEVGNAFPNRLNIAVSWQDARMADPNDSIIRVNATYPQICS
jgi:type IV pilus assembly protein PilV